MPAGAAETTELAALEAADAQLSQPQDTAAAAAAAAAAGPAGANEVAAAAAAAAQPGFDVDAELDRLGAAEKQLRQSARRKVRPCIRKGKVAWSQIQQHCLSAPLRPPVHAAALTCIRAALRSLVAEQGCTAHGSTQ